MMNGNDTLTAWQRARGHLIASQAAPTVLLISTVALLNFGLAEAALPVRLATLGILLASGILGALVQFQSATEAERLATLLEVTEVRHVVEHSARWLWVPKYLTPAVFGAIFLALVWALLGA